MPDVLTDLAARLGPKTALIDDRPDGRIVTWTFAELEATANRLARLLIDLGVKPKDRVLFSSYAGSEIQIEGDDYLILSEDEILAVIDG